MNIRTSPLLLAAAAFTIGPAMAQTGQAASQNQAGTAGHAAHMGHKAKAGVTYGRIKELTPGQTVEVEVDNAPDKTFDLTSKAANVKLATGLKVGDPVRVTERDVNGKKMVSITKHAAGEQASAGHKHAKENK